MNLARKYRPRIFEDVVGQPHPVRFLSGLIQHGQAARSLLLHGAIGSGKTSLVRIYAQALNCEKPTAYGSPCRTCRFCREENGFHEYDTSGRGGEHDVVLRWANANYRTPTEHRWTVLFFDEAQALKDRAADALLKMVEEPLPRVVFCFATTEFAKIRSALRSRLIGLEIKPLSAEEAIALLKACAHLENIRYEPGALELLAGLRHGYARDLLTGLEQVCEPEGRPITIARVRYVFDVDHTERLLTYMRALAEGDPVAQNTAWLAWREAASTKLRWLQALLTGLYYNDVLGQTITVDALIASIQPAERAPILNAFRERLGVALADGLAPYWRAMMAHWTVSALECDETALQLRVSLFHHFVNAELPTLGRGSEPKAHRCSAVREDVRAEAVAADELALSHLPLGGPDRFPTVDDARGVIASASYLMQEHGRLFNARLRIEPALLGIEEEAEAVALIAAFCRDLDEQVRSYSRAPFARLSLVERDLGRGGEVAGRILVHLPEATEAGRSAETVTQIVAWASSWRHKSRLPDRGAVFVETLATERATSLTFHWEGVLDLCAGLSEDAMGWDPIRGALTPLLDLLEIPRSRRRIVGGIAALLIGRSTLLGPREVEKACGNGMPLLSAFEAEEWGHIRSGWELREHADRRRTKTERAAALARIEKVYGDTTEARTRRAELLDTWQGPPEERPRRAWRGWWLTDEV